MRLRFNNLFALVLFIILLMQCGKNSKALRKEVNNTVDSLYNAHYVAWNVQADSICAKFKLDNQQLWMDSIIVVREKEVEKLRREL
jgi:hypothetical protein